MKFLFNAERSVFYKQQKDPKISLRVFFLKTLLFYINYLEYNFLLRFPNYPQFIAKIKYGVRKIKFFPTPYRILS